MSGTRTRLLVQFIQDANEAIHIIHEYQVPLFSSCISKSIAKRMN
jgi:hypothetical protein